MTGARPTADRSIGDDRAFRSARKRSRMPRARTPSATVVHKWRSWPARRVALGGCLLRGRLDAGLIDEFHLYVNPTVLGHGKSIWSRGTSPMAPQTGILQVHDCGVVVQKYVPIRPVGRTS